MNEIDVSFLLFIENIISWQKDPIFEIDETLDGKLWSIAVSHNKPTLGLETMEQREEYARMDIEEKEQV